MRPLLALLLAQSSSSFYVANVSGVGGDGSLGNPFASLQSCANALEASNAPGSECLLLEGSYRLNETVVVQNLHGTPEQPIRIAAAPGHAVTFDGTLDVDGPWTWQNTASGGHWVAAWPEGRPEPWQLFVGDQMMIPARWPNARWDDRTVFDDTYWAHGSSTPIRSPHKYSPPCPIHLLPCC